MRDATRKKITIVGAGRVGATTALWCLIKELGDVVLLNRTASTAKGIALDLMETTPLLAADVSIIGTDDYRKTKDSDVIVITAGAQRKVGMSRDDLVQLNGEIVRKTVKQLVRYNKHAILIVVSNPLDAMVYAAKEASGYPSYRVMGMAGILDTSRFKSFIGKALQVSVEDISALVLGSHGDAMVPLPNHTSVNGIPLTKLMNKKKIHKLIEHTRKAGAEVIKLQQSSAYYSPSASVVEMIESVLKDKKRVLPCAAYLTGQYGVKGIFMGVPTKIGASGVESILELPLDKKEMRAFQASVKHVKELIKKLQ